MPPVGFDLTTPAGKMTQTYHLYGATTGIGYSYICFTEILVLKGVVFLLHHINKSP